MLKFNHYPLFVPATAAVASAFLLGAPPASGGVGHGEGFVGGGPGGPGEVGRTVEIEAKDMRFFPDSVSVEDGETVRFVIHNTDSVEHDFTIGTPEVQAAHREEMGEMYAAGAMDPAAMPGDLNHGGMMDSDGDHGHMSGHMSGHRDAHMEGASSAAMGHDDPNAVMVQPGETKELIWRFERAGELQFACNVPGHYESGMIGRFGFERE